jgi:hypothetical protein
MKLVSIKFLNSFFYSFKYPFKKIVLWVELIKQNENIHLKQDLLIWLGDVLQVGFVCLLNYFLVDTLGLYGFAAGFGITIWLVRQIIKNVREELK